MSPLVEYLSGSWFAMGFMKCLVLTALGTAFISRIRQRDLASLLWAGLLILQPLAFFSGLFPVSWKALPPVAVQRTVLPAAPAASPVPIVPPLAEPPTARDELPTPEFDPTGDEFPAFAESPAVPRLSFKDWLPALWLAGGLATLIPALRCLQASRRLQRSSAPLRMEKLWHRVGNTAARSIPLQLSPDVDAPGLISIFRPRVILPGSAEKWDDERLIAVLRHELHHVTRRDIMFRWLGRFSRALLWFHPAAWWLQSRLVLAQEKAADEAVLAAGVPATEYAGHLLELAVSSRAFPGIAMARRSQLGGRIRHLLAPRSSLSAGRRRMEVASLFAMIPAFAALLPLGFAAADPVQGAEVALVADHGSRPPILDRNGQVIATSDPARMPESLRGNPPDRWYPEGAMLAPVSGYISRDLRGDLVVGKGSGLEDSPLMAEGKTVRSSIDLRIQRLAWEALEKRQLPGAIVVMDPKSGELLAMASWPSCDVNRIADGVTPAEWQTLSEDPASPLLNRAVLPETPGSLAKVLVALAAAKADKARQVIHCGPSYPVGNFRIRDWNKERDEDLDLAGALASSCNTYFIPLAMELGSQAIQDIGLDFGFGSETALPWRGRAVWHGIDRSEGWAKNGELAMAAIGQAGVKYSLLDSARIMSSVASGEIRPPVFTLGTVVPDPVSLASLGIDEGELAIIRRGLVGSAQTLVQAVRESGLGGIVAGKTSTAQAGEKRYSVNFTGYAPADAPRYVVAVRFWAGPNDQPSGGRLAGPVAADLIKRLLSEAF